MTQPSNQSQPCVIRIVLLLVGCIGGATAFAQENVANEHFKLSLSPAGLTSLKHTNDAFDTDYIQQGRSLGGLLISYRAGDGSWTSARTSSLTQGVGDQLQLSESFDLVGDALLWKINMRNSGDKPIEIGDLGFPLAFNTRFQRDKTVTYTQRELLHFWVSGHGSFLYLMRPNGVGPYLVITPTGDTKLEYYDRDIPPATQPSTRPAGGGGGFGAVMYIHS